MKRNIVIILLVTFIIAVFSAAYCARDNWKLVVRVKGTVENQYAGSSKWHLIWQSRKLQDGDKARTQENSRAKIRLADQSVITLGENTEVEMSEFHVKEQSRVAKIKLFLGRIRTRVGRFTGKESKFEVKTPNAVLAARGTDFTTEYVTRSPGKTNVIVFSDSVDVLVNGKKKATVTQGNAAQIDAQGNVIMNPPGVSPMPPGQGKGVDGDMVEYEPEYTEEATDSEVPREPSTVEGAPTGSSPDGTTGEPGGIQPPPGDTGDVYIIIEPQ